MTKLLVMTDVHLVPPPQKIIGLDPRQRLKDGLAHAAENHPDADRLIIMGDLTNLGDAPSYEILRGLLGDVPWPVTLMLGNHDHRETFTGVFPDQSTDPNGYVQSALDIGDARIITLDTLDDAPKIREAGILCKDRIDWLQDVLDTDRPCLMFMHHPPFMTGFTGMDGIALQDAEQFRALLKNGPVKHLFAGHVHRTITATVEGVSMTIFKSTCHQMPMLLGQDGFSHAVDEPGAYGIVTTENGNVIVHFEDFTLPRQNVEQFDR